MTDDELLQKAIHEPVQIVSYDPTWPQKFEAEKNHLLTLLPATFLAIEHVGSTAVPGLPAKPIIDIIAAVRSVGEAAQILPTLCDDGYATSAEFNLTLKDKRWLMRHENGYRTHHLHLVLLNSEEWVNKIAFRDVLRARPDVAERYVSLKMKLAEEIGSDREAYTAAKTDFVNAALAQADTTAS